MGIVCFVILHYKDLFTTDLCVQSILQMNHKERVQIVLVDNDIKETDEKRKMIVNRYRENKQITVLQIKENGGFSYANNQGYVYARNVLNAETVIVVNNDIQFLQKDFLDVYDQILRKFPCHVLGPDIIKQNTNEHQNPLDVRIRSEKEAEYTMKMNQIALTMYPLVYSFLCKNEEREQRKKLREQELNKTFYETIHCEIVPFGACLIFTPEFVKKEENAFSPETPFYYEEYILAYRCKQKGYHIVYHPDLKVLHESGNEIRKSSDNDKKKRKLMMQRIVVACKIYLDFIRNG